MWLITLLQEEDELGTGIQEIIGKQALVASRNRGIYVSSYQVCDLKQNPPGPPFPSLSPLEMSVSALFPPGAGNDFLISP